MTIIWINDQIIIILRQIHIFFQVIKSDADLNLYMYIYLWQFFPDYFTRIVFVEHHQGKKNTTNLKNFLKSNRKKRIKMPANENRIKTYKNKGRDVDVSILDNWKWINLNDINFEVYNLHWHTVIQAVPDFTERNGWLIISTHNLSLVSMLIQIVHLSLYSPIIFLLK